MTSTGATWVGYITNSVATLNITDSGVYNAGTAGTGTMTIGSGTGTTGVLNIGTGGIAGTLNAATISTVGGTGTLNLNHTNNVTLTEAITGPIFVNKLASGIATLTGVSTYTGATTVSAGTLLVNNASGSGTGTSAVFVSSLAKLGGSGTISGNITSSGIIAPGALNALGTLTTGGTVTWNGVSGNAWQFNLGAGATSDKLAVTGALTKGTGTTFAFDFLGGGSAGTYTLLTFASSTFTAADFSYTNLAAGYSATFVKAATSVSLNVVASAVPEPSTYAAIAGVIMLSVVVIRRRKVGSTASA